MGYTIIIQGNVKDKGVVDKLVSQLKAILPELFDTRVSINAQITRTPKINAR